MTKEALLKKTVKDLEQLSEQHLKEVSDFADYLLHKMEYTFLTQEIQKLSSQSEALNFLIDEEDLYTENDLKEKFI